MQRWLPPVALAVFTLSVLLIVAIAGSTLGYDYQAYVGAGRRLLDGVRLYDPSVEVAGPFAIYLYPPPFALAMIPFALLPDQAGLWLWEAGIVAAFLAGVALLPVRAEVRWLIVLLAGLQWPFLYSVKLGQVGPLLFLVFAAGWRWLDRPVGLGVTMALGTLVKVQPALLFGWALVTGRRRAVLVGIVVVLVAAAIATPVIGLAGWADYVELLRRVNTPVTTPHNFTPGAIAYQLGASEATAGIIQLAAYGIAIAACAWAWLRSDAASGYVVTVVASQLLSPLLWDHYAMLLLIPTALLLERRWWWAIAIPLAGWLPSAAYPVMFLVALLAPMVASAPARSAVPGSSAHHP